MGTALLMRRLGTVNFIILDIFLGTRKGLQKMFYITSAGVQVITQIRRLKKDG